MMLRSVERNKWVSLCYAAEVRLPTLVERLAR